MVQRLLDSMFGGPQPVNPFAQMGSAGGAGGAQPFPFMNLAQLFGAPAMASGGAMGDYAGGSIQDLINHLMMNDPKYAFANPRSRIWLLTRPLRWRSPQPIWSTTRLTRGSRKIARDEIEPGRNQYSTTVSKCWLTLRWSQAN